MRIEKSQPWRLKVQINDDVWEEPILSGIYYLKFKRDSDSYYWNGAGWTITDGDYLQLTHDQTGLWYYELTDVATQNEGQFTSFFNSDSNPKIHTSLDVEILRTLHYWTAQGK